MVAIVATADDAIAAVVRAGAVARPAFGRLGGLRSRERPSAPPPPPSFASRWRRLRASAVRELLLRFFSVVELSDLARFLRTVHTNSYTYGLLVRRRILRPGKFVERQVTPVHSYSKTIARAARFAHGAQDPRGRTVARSSATRYSLSRATQTPSR